MGAITKLTTAVSKKESLRTTVPRSIVQQFNLTREDSLDWMIEAKEGELIIVVHPVKGSESHQKESEVLRLNELIRLERSPR